MARWQTQIGIVAGMGALVLVVSCSAFSFPPNECNAERIDQFSSTNYVDRSDCAKCLELKCCDDVGHCLANPACVDAFQKVHQRVRTEPASEQRQLGALVDEQPRRLYKCMREGCADECRIPSCDISPAVTQLGAPACDQCITASCCPQINSCYENRRCKLTLECIVHDCAVELGNGLRGLENLLEEERVSLANQLCKKSEAGVDAGSFDDGNVCIEKCLETFTEGEVDDPEAACAAVQIYMCAAKAKCAGDCKVPGPSPDADASTDANADAPDG